MERRKAVIAAATASLTVLAGAAVVGLTTGIVGASGGDGAGQISPVGTAADATPPTTIYVDEPATEGQATSPGATSQAPSAATSSGRDGRYEDDGAESEDDDRPVIDDREYEDEYEGADDDD
jgi:hypothetical protein